MIGWPSRRNISIVTYNLRKLHVCYIAKRVCVGRYFAMGENRMLSDCVREKLEFDGKLRKIKSELKKYVFDILNEEFTDRPNLNSNNFIINELICEYLKFNNYEHALQVFVDESGQPKFGVGRKTLVKELHVEENSNTQEIFRPLMYSLVHYFTSAEKK